MSQKSHRKARYEKVIRKQGLTGAFAKQQNARQPTLESAKSKLMTKGMYENSGGFVFVFVLRERERKPTTLRENEDSLE